jgi:hypothetical protein
LAAIFSPHPEFAAFPHLEIDISNGYPVVVLHDEALVVGLFGCPRSREAAIGWISNSPYLSLNFLICSLMFINFS